MVSIHKMIVFGIDKGHNSGVAVLYDIKNQTLQTGDIVGFLIISDFIFFSDASYIQL